MKAIKSEFVRFLLVGGSAAVVNIASRYLINFVIGYRYAIVIAYIIGMITAFALSRAFVFSPATSLTTKTQFMRFSLVNVVAALQVWLISVGLAEYLFPSINFSYRAHDIAHIIGVVFPVFTSFFGHKYFSFRQKAD